MERRRDGQQQRAFRALGLEHLTSLLDTGFRAGDHGLFRVIEVDGLDGFAGHGHDLSASLAHRLRIEPEDRRHPAGADRDRILHRLSAITHQRQRIGQAQRTGCDQCGVLAERMPGDNARRHAGRGQPCAVAGDAGGEHHGLGVGGQIELLFRAGVDELRDVGAERIGGFLQGLAHSCVVAPRVEHAGGLRALTGKYECERRHRMRR